MRRIVSETSLGSTPSTPAYVHGTPGKPALIVRIGTRAGEVIVLGPEVTLGRGRACDVRFDEEGVSRMHARISWSVSHRPVLIDLDSHNGTFVGGQRIECITLTDGDFITLGSAVALELHMKEDVIALTPRETDVVALVARGASNREIADQLGIGIRTVESHLSTALSKLHMRSRTELARWYLGRGDK